MMMIIKQPVSNTSCARSRRLLLLLLPSLHVCVCVCVRPSPPFLLPSQNPLKLTFKSFLPSSSSTSSAAVGNYSKFPWPQGAPLERKRGGREGEESGGIQRLHFPWKHWTSWDNLPTSGGGEKTQGVFLDEMNFWSLWDSLDRLKAFHYTNKVFFSKIFLQTWKHFFPFSSAIIKKGIFFPPLLLSSLQRNIADEFQKHFKCFLRPVMPCPVMWRGSEEGAHTFMSSLLLSNGGGFFFFF